MKAETERWLATAHSDALAAGLLAENGFYPQAVFHAHLSVEKVLKAAVTERLSLDRVPHIHNLTILMRMAVDEPPQWLPAFLGTLSAHSVASRYALPPEDSLYTETFADSMLEGANEATEWLRQQLT